MAFHTYTTLPKVNLELGKNVILNVGSVKAVHTSQNRGASHAVASSTEQMDINGFFSNSS